MEKYNKEVLSQVSRADWFSQDSYFWLSNSFQYSENINCDDELHGIKLSQKVDVNTNSNFKNCQLLDVDDKVFAFPFINGWKIRYFTKSNWTWSGTEVPWITIPAPGSIPWWDIGIGNATVFQNKIWVSIYVWNPWQQWTWFFSISQTWTGTGQIYIPYDHNDFTDESISTPDNTKPMQNAVSCVLNFNNSRLIVASWNELRCYYPELDKTNDWQTWWKKVQTYWGWENIIALTCTFEYLKVWVQDSWFNNTKVFFYQANDDFRSTFVYNQIDLKDVKVMRVYSINGIDYYTESLDWTDWFISFNKLIGSTPVQIFTRKGWLVSEDIFSKAWYFIWPTSLDANYQNGYFYVADAHWVFKFKYNPSWKDSWYLKWKINDTKQSVVGLCICENYLYVSYANGLYRTRLYDTWQDWYQDYGILISREMEGNQFQGCFTKMLDEVRLNYELNYLLDEGKNWKIEVFVSPNNRWTDTNPSWTGSDWRYKVMEITSEMKNTRTQISHLLNNFNNQTGETWFEYDRQTITYLIKISIGNDKKATPIVREIQLRYHTKGKTNELYDIK